MVVVGVVAIGKITPCGECDSLHDTFRGTSKPMIVFRALFSYVDLQILLELSHDGLDCYFLRMIFSWDLYNRASMVVT